MIEQRIDFHRPRWVECDSCRFKWPATTAWLDGFQEGFSACQQCGADYLGELRPKFCAGPEDPIQIDSVARGVYWYHSSTLTDWPQEFFDPVSGWSQQTRLRMISIAGPGAVERATVRLKSKALHVGAYEAAIENMFRRMRDQADFAAQFYLYRVRLKADCVIAPGIREECSDFMGGVWLSEQCPPGTKVLRYVNRFEDPSRVSLALERSAIQAV